MNVNDSLLAYRGGGREKAREEGRCRMCLRASLSLTRHHLVPKRWHGWDRMRGCVTVRDCDSNIVPLCVACHRAVEADEWARRMLRKVLGPAEVAFAVQMRGQRWFDGRYPPARALRRPPALVS